MRGAFRRGAGWLAAGLLLGTGFTVSTAIADSFSDVPNGSFFADEIDWLTDYDIANGFPDGTFDPGGNIKRQQAALWMANLSDEFELVQNTNNNPSVGNFANIEVTCPGDKRVLAGGGLHAAFGDLVMIHSYPSSPSTWHIAWASSTGGTVDPGSLSAWALCAPRLAQPPG